MTATIDVLRTLAEDDGNYIVIDVTGRSRVVMKDRRAGRFARSHGSQPGIQAEATTPDSRVCAFATQVLCFEAKYARLNQLRCAPKFVPIVHY
jgi:hypothetical protein